MKTRITIDEVEALRQDLQMNLDSLKTKQARNIFGQFSTPNPLAVEIARQTYSMLPCSAPVRFLDPAIGTGVFFSALTKVTPQEQIIAARGYEIDVHYGLPAQELWSKSPLEYEIDDFILSSPPKNERDKYNLILCNPPYVRHHHLKAYAVDYKKTLKFKVAASLGSSISSLAGLYCYFVLLSHQWLQKDGVACWLIPSEFMDVNYGMALKSYLANKVTLLRIHRFEPSNVQFGDALVSSAIVWIRNSIPDREHHATFSYGGSLSSPRISKKISLETLCDERKWTRFPLADARANDTGIHSKLSDYFTVKRGIATGDNSFFVLSERELHEKNLPISQFRPVLPSPRHLDLSEVSTDEDGVPQIEKKLFVLNTYLPIQVIKLRFPELFEYLKQGEESGVNSRYICRNRKAWYFQERRPSSYFYCTYIGRSGKKRHKPFRFILNHSEAIVTNSYLILYPKPALRKLIHKCPDRLRQTLLALDRIGNESMLAEGRVYGGGMNKLEPKELANVDAREIKKLFQVFT